MKKILLKLFPIFAFIAFFPVTTFAATAACPEKVTNFGDIICKFGVILNSLIPVIVALGVVYFVWGVVVYVIADGEEAKKKGKDRMIFGIIGFTVIVGLWGLVNIVIKTFDLSATTPKINTSTCSLPPNPQIKDLLDYGTCVIANSVIPLLFALAAVMFIWGVINYFIINADEEAKRAQGRQFMIWGIVALAVMISVWSLVNIVGNTFGFSTSALPTVKPPTQQSQ